MCFQIEDVKSYTVCGALLFFGAGCSHQRAAVSGMLNAMPPVTARQDLQGEVCELISVKGLRKRGCLNNEVKPQKLDDNFWGFVIYGKTHI